MKISVIICTYNRPELLKIALQSLCKQTISRAAFEVIVVDNNSASDIRSIISRYSSTLNVRYEKEKKQGLSNARNLGWKAAEGEYVAYIDDDCKVPSFWLETALRVIKEKKPKIFGGPYHSFYCTPIPKWFKNEYGSHIQGNEARALQKEEYLDGGNLFIEREIFEKIGGFKEELGMTGNKIAMGEETAIQMLYRERMPEGIIYYDPELVVYHLVRPEKMDLFWIMCHKFADGRCLNRISQNNKQEKESKFGLMLRAALLIAESFKELIYKIIIRDRKKYPYIKNYIYEAYLKYVQQLGSIYERVVHGTK
jgi:glucosyl-dolichyl phosphate glucuronosyltransferase